MKDNTITNNSLLVALVVLISSFFIPVAVANDTQIVEPQVLVKDSTEKMLHALKEHQDALKEDPSLIYGLVESIIMPNFDFNKIAKLALGKNWRKATVEQREQFIEQFRLLLIRTYSTAMLEYTDQEIKYLPFRGDLKKKKVKVPMEIIQAGGPSIPMVLSMYLNKQGEWKVYDVKIEGVSLVTNYRSTFSNQIRTEGMDKLIENLAKKNEKVTTT